MSFMIATMGFLAWVAAASYIYELTMGIDTND